MAPQLNGAGEIEILARDTCRYRTSVARQYFAQPRAVELRRREVKGRHPGLSSPSRTAQRGSPPTSC